MIGLRQSTLWGAAAVAFVAALSTEGWLLLRFRRAAQTAAATLAARQREWRTLAALRPPPTPAGAEAVEADCARAEAQLRALEDELGNYAEAAALPADRGPGPTSSAEAFFELAGLIQRLRQQAEAAGIQVRIGEQFGFSAYVHQGPGPALVAGVQRQRGAIEYLIGALGAARPKQLLAVQRTWPGGAAAPSRTTLEADAAEGPDLFVLDSRLGLREPGLLETDGVRLVFTGYTATLRRLLNRLAGSGLPFVVRGVEVEPVAGAKPGRTAGTIGDEPPVQIVRPGLSRFTVTVEHVALHTTPQPGASATAEQMARPPAAGAPTFWGEAAAQQRGRGWVYDLFTPPSVYCDRLTGEARAVPTTEAGRGESLDGARFDLVLREVRRGAFRLQLVGFASGPGGLRGIFADRITGETVLGRAGEVLSASGLRLDSLTLEQPKQGSDAEAASEVHARACVRDEDAGEATFLTNNSVCLTGPPEGLFASRTDPGFHRELAAGDSVELGGASYCVERVDLAPPQAVVVCVARGVADPLIKTLAPEPLRESARVAAPPPAREKAEPPVNSP